MAKKRGKKKGKKSANRAPSQKELRDVVAAPDKIFRSIWTESVASGLTPDRLASVLLTVDAGGDPREYFLLAEEIEERDWHYRSVLQTRKDEVRGLPHEIMAPHDPTPEDEEIAAACRRYLLTSDLYDLESHLLDGLGKGYGIVEFLWMGGMRWLPKYEYRHPWFFLPDRTDGRTLHLRTTADPDLRMPLPPYKFAIHTPQLKSGLPIRAGLARLGMLAYVLKRYTIADWMQFAELFGIPWVIGKYAAGASAEDLNNLFAAIQGLGGNGKLMIRDTMMLEVLDGVRADGAALFATQAKWVDDQVSELVLGQTASTGGTPGKLGAETEQTNVRTTILIADGRDLARTINRDLIIPWVNLNYGPREMYPEIVISPVEQQDITAIATALGSLLPQGLRVSQKAVLDLLHLPAPMDMDDTLGSPATTSMHRGPTRPYASAGDRAVEEFLDPALSEWEPAIASVLRPIRALVTGADGIEDARLRIESALNGRSLEESDLQFFTDHLARLTFQARGVGDARD